MLVMDGKEIESCGGELESTNNRMELMGVIAGVRSLTEPCRGTIYSDSMYTVWACQRKPKWEKKFAAGKLPNADLVLELWHLLAGHQFRAEWVRGHSGVRLNERCDRLAESGALALSELPHNSEMAHMREICR